MKELIQQLYSRYQLCHVVSADSRRITKGCLFFGLKGEHVDGSQFGASAVDQGASAAIVRHGECEARPDVYFVKDPLSVLQKLAQYHREHLTIPILAITGSNGKTTTKELIFRVLASTYTVRATLGNLNNHIGVPLTLLSMKPTDQIAIVEMGANHPGEIRLLCELARPTHGIVTNIGKAHLEGFGGIEGVRRAKAELYESIEQHDGVPFVNRNEMHLKELSERIMKRVFYGFDKQVQFTENDFRFVLRQSESGSTVLFRDANHVEWTATSSLFGAFNLANIATAIATGLFFGVAGDKICSAIASYVPDNNRAQRLSIGSNTFIMDAYNANPTSMISAIESFKTIRHPNKYLILGSMMELGVYGPTEHLEIAQLVSILADFTVILVGDQFKTAASKMHKQWYSDVDELKRIWNQNPPSHALILIKGSRAMHLESLLSAFQ